MSLLQFNLALIKCTLKCCKMVLSGSSDSRKHLLLFGSIQSRPEINLDTQLFAHRMFPILPFVSVPLDAWCIF